MLTKLTLGEKLKDLRLAKGYTSTEHLASVLNCIGKGKRTAKAGRTG